MNIVVCVKAVPLVEGVDITVKDNSIAGETLKYAINEYDEYALEEAVLLKEKNGGAVTVITLTAENVKKEAEQVIRECYAKGADKAILLVDAAAQNFDPYMTTRILAKAIKDLSFDLILTGIQATDNNWAATGPILAQLLGLPHSTLTVSLEMKGDDVIRVQRGLEEDFKEVVELRMPALLTIHSGINTPRYAPFSKIRAAMKMEIKTLALKDIGLEQATVESWRRSIISSMRIPVSKKRSEIISGKPEEEAAALAKVLREKGFGGA